jgi:hypothetical protein
MKSVRLSHPILQTAFSETARRNRLEGKSLHERQADGLGRFSVWHSLTSISIDLYDLEILCKGARHAFLSYLRYPHCLLRVSGRAMMIPTTRTLAQHKGVVSHVAHTLTVDGNP